MRWCSLTSSAQASSSRAAQRWMSDASLPSTSLQVIARTGFTDSSPPIVALPPRTLRHRFSREVPENRDSPRFRKPGQSRFPLRRNRDCPGFGPATLGAVKRILAGSVLLALSAAGVYGYTLSERERTYRQKIADGDAALANENTSAAIEAFSGAITLKDQAMLGYLKRGQTYRRRGEFVAGIRDLRGASELDATAPQPLEDLGAASP